MRAVYAIHNLLTGDKYVGSTGNYERRWREHFRDLKNGKHCNRRLQRAWQKFGEQAFIHGVIEDVLDGADLAAIEQRYLSLGRYNAMRTAHVPAGYLISAAATIYDVRPGMIFGRLEVKEEAKPVAGKSGYRFRCECSCGSGKTIFAKAHDLVKGVISGCGCKPNAASGEKHGRYLDGRSGTPEFYSYQNMMNLCLNAATPSYGLYGGNGITVCDRWRGEYGFLNFLNDVGHRPHVGLVLSRFPNRNGDYEPGNVRWATLKERSRSRLNAATYTISGVTKTVAEWAECSGVSYGTIVFRIKNGFKPEDVIRPVGSFNTRGELKCHWRN